MFILNFAGDNLVYFPALLVLKFSHSMLVLWGYLFVSYLLHMSQEQSGWWLGMFSSIFVNAMLRRGTDFGRIRCVMSVIKLLCYFLWVVFFL